MKTELQEIILIARCIKEENKTSERLKYQCDRIENLSNVVDSENYCKSCNSYNNGIRETGATPNLDAFLKKITALSNKIKTLFRMILNKQ